MQKFLQSLKDSGHIYAGKYEGPYCVGCEEFKLPGDLIDIDGAKCCPIHSKPIELVNENNWFFKLSAFVEPLLAHYKNNPDACQPESARNDSAVLYKTSSNEAWLAGSFASIQGSLIVT